MNYRKGYIKEIKAVHELKRRGYIAFRSAGSRSPFDVVGISSSEILLLQVKSGSGRRHLKDEIRKLKEIRVPKCVRKQIWLFGRRLEIIEC